MSDGIHVPRETDRQEGIFRAGKRTIFRPWPTLTLVGFQADSVNKQLMQANLTHLGGMAPTRWSTMTGEPFDCQNIVFDNNTNPNAYPSVRSRPFICWCYGRQRTRIPPQTIFNDRQDG